MKATATVLQFVALLASASAQSAYLWTVDQSVISSSTASIDTTTASSILARRRGLTDSTYLRTNDESVLKEVNVYGGYQQPLFGETTNKEAPGKLFIRISGFDGEITQLSSAMPDLWIQSPSKDLQHDFKVATSQREGLCEYSIPPSLNAKSSKGVEVIFTYPLGNEKGCLPPKEITFIPVIMSLQAVLPTDPTTIPKTIGTLVRILKHLSATENVESTVLVLPSKLANPKDHHYDIRADPSESPLEFGTATPSTLPSSYDLYVPTANHSSNMTLPRVIPQCFTSISACENTTNGCSGHGSCYKRTNNCYKCKCGTTISRINDDGSKKTVQWGGNACQKKDISVEFILFASFGVVFTALIAGGIGMLWGMGSQELPSVIGAGVAGPSARK